MIWKNWRHMLRSSWFQTISAIGIISFLLFFVNVLALVSFQFALSRVQIQDKLGVYFYLNDTVSEKDVTYAKAIDMMDQLTSAGLEVTFYSKEDAFSLLAKRLPNVIDSLEKFDIANPLPPTLYVLFDNQSEYETMKTVVLNYEDIIVNLDDITSSLSFGEQERRVSNVVNLMNFLQYLSYFLISVTILIVVAFLLYAIRLNFFRFHRQLEVEKLLGASYTKIITPFLLYIWLILVVAFLLASTYIWRILSYVNIYFLEVFSLSLYDMLPSWDVIVRFIFAELFLVIIANMFFATLSLWWLLRKI